MPMLRKVGLRGEGTTKFRYGKYRDTVWLTNKADAGGGEDANAMKG